MGPVTGMLAIPLPAAPPPDRGRLLTPAQVAELIGGVSEAWCRRQVPYKLRLGHSTCRWYENDVRQWLEQQRQPKPVTDGKAGKQGLGLEGSA